MIEYSVNYIVSYWKEQVSLEDVGGSRSGADMYKIILNILLGQISRELSKTTRFAWKDSGDNLKSFLWPNMGQFETNKDKHINIFKSMGS